MIRAPEIIQASPTGRTMFRASLEEALRMYDHALDLMSAALRGDPTADRGVAEVREAAQDRKRSATDQGRAIVGMMMLYLALRALTRRPRCANCGKPA